MSTILPPPRIHRHRYHGVFAPNAPLRPLVTARTPDTAPSRPSRWAALLARIYEVFPLVCPTCQEPLTFVAFLTDPEPIPEDNFDQTWGA